MGQVIYQRAKTLFDFRNALRLFGEPAVAASDSYISFPGGAGNPTRLDRNGSNFTVSLWVHFIRRGAVSTPNRQHPVLRWGTAGVAATVNASLMLDFEEDVPPDTATAMQARFRLRYRASGGTAEATSSYITPVNAWSRWMHVAMRRDSTAGTLSLWVDGVQVVNLTGIGGPTDIFGTENYLGKGQRESSLNGYVDDLVFFDEALSNAEIVSMHNGGMGGYPPVARFGAVTAAWRFDNLSGTVVSNDSGLFNSVHNAGAGTLLNYNIERTQSYGKGWVSHWTLQPQDFYLSDYADTASAYVDGVNDNAGRAVVNLTNIRTVEIEVMATRAIPAFFTENVTGTSWTGLEFHRHLLGNDGFPQNPGSFAAIYLAVGTNGIALQGHRNFAYLNQPLAHAVVLPDNAFTHVAFVFDAAHRASLYVNGAFVKLGVAGQNAAWGVYNLSVGINEGFNSLNWQGRWKNLRVWDYERSAAQINANKTATLGSETGLLLNISGQRSSPTQNSFNDASGNARHLAMSNYILQP